MLRPKMSRLIAALALATGLFSTMPGCAGNKPASESKGDKKTDGPALSISADPNTSSSTDPSTKIAPLPPPVEKIDLNIGVGKDATDFLASLKNGAVSAKQLSSGFVKSIGLPAVFPADKAKGYSAEAAEGLLIRALGRHGLGPLAISKQVGNVALFRGMFIGEPGDISLRMIHEGGAWKVDWLSLSSARIEGGTLNTSNADTVCQEFAIAATIGLLTDKDALTKEDRAVILATGLTPALKKKWAEPLDSDKAEGYDYNRGSLAQKTLQFGAGVESFSFSQQGNAPVFRVELLHAGGGKTAYLVKLVNGPGPGQWLVDEVTPQ
jgi:hypothetical protein